MQYRMKLRAAEKFAIDDEAVRLCCNLSHEQDQLDHWAILARLPYDTLWIEYSLHEKMREFSRMGSVREFVPEQVSPRLGVLLYRDRQDTPAWVAHQFYEFRGDILPSPVALIYDPEGEAHAPVRGSLTWRQPTLSLVPDFPKIPYDQRGRGSNQLERSGMVTPEAVVCGDFEPSDSGPRARPWSIHRTAVITDPWWHARSDMPDKAKLRLIAAEVVETAGALRWLVTFLATLNALPREIHEVIPKRGKRQVGANMLPYFQHRTVTLQIPKANAVVWARGHMASSASHGRNAPRPWHQVRGHWRLAEYRKDRSGIICHHEPELVENGLAVCSKCELLVRWVDSFHRGSAETGMIEHDYRITAKKRKPKEEHP
jgi:hypothetical protein